MRKLTLITIIHLIPVFVFSQTKIFLDEELKETSISKAVYYEIRSNHPEYDYLELIKRYYLTDTLKSIATYSRNDKKLDGPYESYFEDGTKESEGNYVFGEKSGVWIDYYENGLKQIVRDYRKLKDSEWDYIVREYWRRDGTKSISDGNGKYVDYHNNGAIKTMGWYKSGLKDSVWNGYRDDSTRYFTEEYKLGRFKKGVSWNEQGDEFQYTQIEEAAEYSKGWNQFYQKVGELMRYPIPARRDGIEGTVYVQFIITKDGLMKDIEVIKSPADILSIEAKRVIKKIKGWNPPKQRGQNVKQRIVLPIMFALG